MKSIGVGADSVYVRVCGLVGDCPTWDKTRKEPEKGGIRRLLLGEM